MRLMYVTLGINIHQTNALTLGADEALLQEVKTLCIYAVGLQAIWND